MAKYRQRLVVVDAEQFFHDRKPWPDGVVLQDPDNSNPHKPRFFTITTVMGQCRVSEGDWIVTDHGGCRCCVAPGVFELFYELDLGASKPNEHVIHNAR